MALKLSEVLAKDLRYGDLVFAKPDPTGAFSFDSEADFYNCRNWRSDEGFVLFCRGERLHQHKQSGKAIESLLDDVNTEWSLVD